MVAWRPGDCLTNAPEPVGRKAQKDLALTVANKCVFALPFDIQGGSKWRAGQSFSAMNQRFLEIRANRERRDAHVAFAKAHPELLIGGGLKPDVGDEFCGALWIVEAESRADVEALIRADPFYVKDLRNFEIYTWGKILEDQSVTL